MSNLDDILKLPCPDCNRAANEPCAQWRTAGRTGRGVCGLRVRSWLRDQGLPDSLEPSSESLTFPRDRQNQPRRQRRYLERTSK